MSGNTNSNSNDKALWSQIAIWAAGQPFNNVLLLLILCAIGWSAHFTVTTAIPLHLKQIQEGYESLQGNHRQEREKEHELHRKEREDALKTYDKWVDRMIEKKPN